MMILIPPAAAAATAGGAAATRDPAAEAAQQALSQKNTRLVSRQWTVLYLSSSCDETDAVASVPLCVGRTEKQPATGPG